MSILGTLSTVTVGLERVGADSCNIGIAHASYQGKGTISRLISIRADETFTHLLPDTHPFYVVALRSSAVLVRSLVLPLTQKKEIAEALEFQLEPILPYPVEEGIFTFQTIPDGEQTYITVFAARKESLQEEIRKWEEFAIHPERITSIPQALTTFAHFFLSSDSPLLLFHLGDGEATVLYLDGGNELKTLWLPYSALNPSSDDFLSSAPVQGLAQTVLKLAYAITKQPDLSRIHSVCFVGPDSQTPLNLYLSNYLELPLQPLKPLESFSSEELHRFALPMGLALAHPSSVEWQVNFIQQDALHEQTWNRLKKGIFSYLFLILSAAFLFWWIGERYQERALDEARGNYLSLLTAMNHSPQQVEDAFMKSQGVALSVPFDPMVISLEGIKDRTLFIHKQLLSSPVDAFPFLPHVPLVSELLIWLNQHPAFIYTNDQGDKEKRLVLESLSYTMVKRPEVKKKEEKYQVKVDLEFSAEKPQWAREFHDALITPNRFVDPKGEVKWGSNRGRYKTSFFLKDHTVYTGGS